MLVTVPILLRDELTTSYFNKNHEKIPQILDALLQPSSDSTNASLLGLVIDVSLRLRVGKEKKKGGLDGVGMGYVMQYKVRNPSHLHVKWPALIAVWGIYHRIKSSSGGLTKSSALVKYYHLGQQLHSMTRSKWHSSPKTINRRYHRMPKKHYFGRPR